MRLNAVLLAIPLMVPGCFTITDHRVLPGVTFEGVPLRVELTTTTHQPSGAIVYRFDNPLNTSAFFEFAFHSRAGTLDPFHILLLLDDGSEPYRLITPFEDPADDRGRVHVGLAGIQQEQSISSPSGVSDEAGAYAVFEGARGGYLLVMWANYSEPVTIQSYWLEGTVIEEQLRVDSAFAADLASIEGGTVVAADQAGLSRGAAFRLDGGDQQWFGILQAAHPRSTGEISVSDDERTRTQPLASTYQSYLTFTSEGSTTVGLDAVGDIRAFVTAASFPRATFGDVWSYILMPVVPS